MSVIKNCNSFLERKKNKAHILKYNFLASVVRRLISNYKMNKPIYQRKENKAFRIQENNLFKITEHVT